MYKDKDTGFNGVLNYIYKYHPDIIPKNKDVNQKFAFVRKLQRLFLNKSNIDYKRNFEYRKTQKNWKQFKIFLKENY